MATGKIQYTSHPIRRLKIGREFQFEDSLLTLEDEEQEERFLAVINDKNFPKRDRHNIKKLDFAMAEKISKEVQATKAHVTQVTDSSVGNRAQDARVGVGDLLAQQKEAADKAGESGAEAASGAKPATPLPENGKFPFGKPTE